MLSAASTLQTPSRVNAASSFRALGPSSSRLAVSRPDRHAVSDACQLGDALDLRGPRNHAESEPVGGGLGGPVHDEPQRRRVQETYVAEIERDAREPERPQLGQLGLYGRHRREIELTDRTNGDRCPSGLDLASKRLDL